MAKMSGSRLFAEVIHGYGVTHVFYVPTILMRALAEMDDFRIRKIMTHGEKAAAYMADGYARASGKPGVCMAQHDRRVESRGGPARRLSGVLAR